MEPTNYNIYSSFYSGVKKDVRVKTESKTEFEGVVDSEKEHLGRLVAEGQSVHGVKSEEINRSRYEALLDPAISEYRLGIGEISGAAEQVLDSVNGLEDFVSFEEVEKEAVGNVAKSLADLSSRGIDRNKVINSRLEAQGRVYVPLKGYQGSQLIMKIVKGDNGRYLVYFIQAGLSQKERHQASVSPELGELRDFRSAEYSIIPEKFDEFLEEISFSEERILDPINRRDIGFVYDVAALFAAYTPDGVRYLPYDPYYFLPNEHFTVTNLVRLAVYDELRELARNTTGEQRELFQLRLDQKVMLDWYRDIMSRDVSNIKDKKGFIREKKDLIRAIRYLSSRVDRIMSESEEKSGELEGIAARLVVMKGELNTGIKDKQEQDIQFSEEFEAVQSSGVERSEQGPGVNPNEFQGNFDPFSDDIMKDLESLYHDIHTAGNNAYRQEQQKIAAQKKVVALLRFRELSRRLEDYPDKQFTGPVIDKLKDLVMLLQTSISVHSILNQIKALQTNNPVEKEEQFETLLNGFDREIDLRTEISLRVFERLKFKLKEYAQEHLEAGKADELCFGFKENRNNSYADPELARLVRENRERNTEETRFIPRDLRFCHLFASCFADNQFMVIQENTSIFGPKYGQSRLNQYNEIVKVLESKDKSPFVQALIDDFISQMRVKHPNFSLDDLILMFSLESKKRVLAINLKKMCQTAYDLNFIRKHKIGSILAILGTLSRPNVLSLENVRDPYGLDSGFSFEFGQKEYLHGYETVRGQEPQEAKDLVSKSISNLLGYVRHSDSPVQGLLIYGNQHLEQFKEPSWHHFARAFRAELFADLNLVQELNRNPKEIIHLAQNFIRNGYDMYRGQEKYSVQALWFLKLNADLVAYIEKFHPGQENQFLDSMQCFSEIAGYNFVPFKMGYMAVEWMRTILAHPPRTDEELLHQIPYIFRCAQLMRQYREEIPEYLFDLYMNSLGVQLKQKIDDYMRRIPKEGLGAIALSINSSLDQHLEWEWDSINRSLMGRSVEDPNKITTLSLFRSERKGGVVEEASILFVKDSELFKGLAPLIGAGDIPVAMEEDGLYYSKDGLTRYRLDPKSKRLFEIDRLIDGDWYRLETEPGLTQTLYRSDRFLWGDACNGTLKICIDKLTGEVKFKSDRNRRLLTVDRVSKRELVVSKPSGLRKGFFDRLDPNNILYLDGGNRVELLTWGLSFQRINGQYVCVSEAYSGYVVTNPQKTPFADASGMIHLEKDGNEILLMGGFQLNTDQEKLGSRVFSRSGVFLLDQNKTFPPFFTYRHLEKDGLYECDPSGALYLSMKLFTEGDFKRALEYLPRSDRFNGLRPIDVALYEQFIGKGISYSSPEAKIYFDELRLRFENVSSDLTTRLDPKNKKAFERYGFRGEQIDPFLQNRMYAAGRKKEMIFGARAENVVSKVPTVEDIPFNHLNVDGFIYSTLTDYSAKLEGLKEEIEKAEEALAKAEARLASIAEKLLPKATEAESPVPKDEGEVARLGEEKKGLEEIQSKLNGELEELRKQIENFGAFFIAQFFQDPRELVKGLDDKAKGKLLTFVKALHSPDAIEARNGLNRIVLLHQFLTPEERTLLDLLITISYSVEDMGPISSIMVLFEQVANVPPQQVLDSFVGKEKLERVLGESKPLGEKPEQIVLSSRPIPKNEVSEYGIGQPKIVGEEAVQQKIAIDFKGIRILDNESNQIFAASALRFSEVPVEVEPLELELADRENQGQTEKLIRDKLRKAKQEMERKSEKVVRYELRGRSGVDEIKTEMAHKVKELKEKRAEKKELILQLANKKKITDVHHSLVRTFKGDRRLKWSDLKQGYLLGDYSHILKYNPDVSEDDLKKIMTLMIDYLDLTVASKRCQNAWVQCGKINEASSDGDYAIEVDRLGQMFNAKRAYTVAEFPLLLYFEAMTGIMLREDQFKAIEWAMRQVKGSGPGGTEHIARILQAYAGFGKTKVFTTILAMMIHNENGKLPIVFQIPQLYDVGSDDLAKSLYEAFKARLKEFPLEINANLDTETLKGIITQLKKYKKEGVILIAKPITWHKLNVEYKRLLAIDPRSPSVEPLREILDFWKTETFNINDEGHLIYSPLQDVNIASGDFEIINPGERAILLENYNFVFGLDERNKLVNLGNNMQMLAPGVVVTQVKERLVRHMLPVFMEKVKRLAPIADKKRLPLPNEEMLTELFLSPSGVRKPKWLDDLLNSGSEEFRLFAEEVSLQYGYCSSILATVLAKQAEVDYGNSVHAGDPTVAPKEKKNSTLAKFEKKYITAALTIQHLYQSSYKDGLARERFDQLLALVIKDQNELNGSLGVFKAFSWEYAQALKATGEVHIDFARFDRDKLYEVCKHSKAIQHLYLEFIGLPAIKTSTSTTTSTPAEMLTQTSGILLTATPKMLETLPLPLTMEVSIRDEHKLDPESEYATLCSMASRRNSGEKSVRVVGEKDVDTAVGFFRSMYSDEAQGQDIQKLSHVIDGGKMFDKISETAFVEGFIEVFKAKHPKVPKIVIYTKKVGNERRDYIYHWDGQKGVHHEMKGSSVEENLKKLNIPVELVKTSMTYYSIQETTGKDWKLPLGTHGLFTVGMNQGMSEAIQNGKRNRRLEQADQTMVYVMLPQIRDKILASTSMPEVLNLDFPEAHKRPPKTAEIIEWMIIQEAQEMESLLIPRFEQAVRAILVNQALYVRESQPNFAGLQTEARTNPSFEFFAEEAAGQSDMSSFEVYALDQYRVLFPKSPITHFDARRFPEMRKLIDQMDQLLPKGYKKEEGNEKQQFVNEMVEQEQEQEQEVQQQALVQKIQIVRDQINYHEPAQNPAPVNLHLDLSSREGNQDGLVEMFGTLDRGLRTRMGNNDEFPRELLRYIQDKILIPRSFLQIMDRGRGIFIRSCEYVLVNFTGNSYRMQPLSRSQWDAIRNNPERAQERDPDYFVVSNDKDFEVLWKNKPELEVERFNEYFRNDMEGRKGRAILLFLTELKIEDEEAFYELIKELGPIEFRNLQVYLEKFNYEYQFNKGVSYPEEQIGEIKRKGDKGWFAKNREAGKAFAFTEEMPRRGWVMEVEKVERKRVPKKKKPVPKPPVEDVSLKMEAAASRSLEGRVKVVSKDKSDQIIKAVMISSAVFSVLSVIGLVVIGMELANVTGASGVWAWEEISHTVIGGVPVVVILGGSATTFIVFTMKKRRKAEE